MSRSRSLTQPGGRPSATGGLIISSASSVGALCVPSVLRLPQSRLMGLLDEADPGDDAAFAEVYERTCTPVYLEVLRVLRDPHRPMKLPRRSTFSSSWTRKLPPGREPGPAR